jgi:hypothetical protein
MRCPARLSILLISLISILPIVFADSVYSSQQGVPVLSRVILNGDSVINTGSGFNEKELPVNYRNNNIRYELLAIDTFSIQYFLKGFDEKWSSWDVSNYKEYTNLNPGTYTFIAR